MRSLALKSDGSTIVTFLSLTSEEPEAVKARKLLNAFIAKHGGTPLGKHPQGVMPDWSIVKYRDGKFVRIRRHINLCDMATLRSRVLEATQ